MRRALWTYTVCHTKSVRRQNCANQPVKMRRSDPQTSLFRSYTPPTNSDGADHWCNLQLSAWAFRTSVSSNVIPPKSRCDRDGAESRWFDLERWLNRNEENKFSESFWPRINLNWFINYNRAKCSFTKLFFLCGFSREFFKTWHS